MQLRSLSAVSRVLEVVDPPEQVPRLLNFAPAHDLRTPVFAAVAENDLRTTAYLVARGADVAGDEDQGEEVKDWAAAKPRGSPLPSASPLSVAGRRAMEQREALGGLGGGGGGGSGGGGGGGFVAARDRFDVRPVDVAVERGYGDMFVFLLLCGGAGRALSLPELVWKHRATLADPRTSHRVLRFMQLYLIFRTDSEGGRDRAAEGAGARAGGGVAALLRALSPAGRKQWEIGRCRFGCGSFS